MTGEQMMSEWQPIETAPRDGTKIIVFTIHGDIEISEYYTRSYDEYEFALATEDGPLYRAVAKVMEGWNSNVFEYWMPLPQPPKDHP